MKLHTIIIIYIVVIVVLHIIPTESGPALDQLAIGPLRGDYLLHTLLFLPWMVLAWFYLHRGKISQTEIIRALPRWLVAGLLLALFSEGLQLFLTYRSFNPLDLLFNISGIILGTLIFMKK